jgi:hypothetical protein
MNFKEPARVMAQLFGDEICISAILEFLDEGRLRVEHAGEKHWRVRAGRGLWRG